MGTSIAIVPRSAALSPFSCVRPEVENDLAFTRRRQKFFLERFPGRRGRRKADTGNVRSGAGPRNAVDRPGAFASASRVASQELPSRSRSASARGPWSGRTCRSLPKGNRALGSAAGQAAFLVLPPPARPARSSTPSRRFANSRVAGAMGRRCSFLGMIPSFFIMYLMAMGLVSKNTA